MQHISIFCTYIVIHFPRNPVEPVTRMVLSRKHPATATVSMASYRDMWIEIDEPEYIGDVGFSWKLEKWSQASQDVAVLLLGVA